MSFKDLLLLAKRKEPMALSELVRMYKPLLIKESVVDGVFDEDLYQELILTLIHCIETIKA